MSDISRLRWQCRRGMRELDVLLLDYLETRYPEAGEAEKSAFRELLTLADPELNAYLLQKQSPGSEDLSRVVERILRRNRT